MVLKTISIFILIILITGSLGKSQVIILANSIDIAKADSLLNYLIINGFTPIHLGSNSTSKLESSPFVIVLGGHRSPEGIGDIVDDILDDEQKKLLLKGSGSTIQSRTEGVWMDGQVVWILAGYNSEDTRKAHGKYIGKVTGSMKNMVENGLENIQLESHIDGGNLSVYESTIGFNIRLYNNNTFPISVEVSGFNPIYPENISKTDKLFKKMSEERERCLQNLKKK